jgi:probable rRNA maturation factor
MPPRYKEAAQAVLPGWEISLAYPSETLARRLNKKLRGKNYVPNVLSYRAGPKHGEIIICKEVARKQAPVYGMSAGRFRFFLFIHGLLHLKGMRHGSTMEQREQSLLRRFAGARPRVTNGSTHRNRHRHRDLPGQDRRRRGGAR